MAQAALALAFVVWLESNCMLLWGAFAALRRRAWSAGRLWVIWGAALWIIMPLCLARLAGEAAPAGGAASGFAGSFALVCGGDMLIGGAVAAFRRRRLRAGAWWMAAGAGALVLAGVWLTRP